MNLNESIQALIASIQSSKEYGDFSKSKSLIDASPVLKENLKDFYQKQADLYNSKLEPQEFEVKAKELDTLYLQLLKTKEFSSFDKTSKNLEDSLHKIFKNIEDALYL